MTQIIARTALVLIVILMLFFYIGAVLYFTKGIGKGFFHDILHWHTPDKSTVKNIGLGLHARCKHCNKKIEQDSQGNWFEIE